MNSNLFHKTLNKPLGGKSARLPDICYQEEKRRQLREITDGLTHLLAELEAPKIGIERWKTLRSNLLADIVRPLLSILSRSVTERPRKAFAPQAFSFFPNKSGGAK